MATVLIVTQDKYPNGDAGAVRDQAFAKMYQELGYDVKVISGVSKASFGEYDGVVYVGSAEEGSGLKKQIRSQLFAARRISEAVKIIMQNTTPDIIHYVAQAPAASIWLKKYARKNNCKMIYACVEWYSPCNYTGGRLSIPYVINHWLNRHYIDKNFGVIAISTFFESYFKKKGNKVVRIPVIMNMEEYTPNYLPNKDKVRIAYVGSPDRKDNVHILLQALDALQEEKRKRIKIDLVGVNENVLMQMCRADDIDINKVKEHVKVHGRVKREEALEVVKMADFSFLLRPAKEVYTKAGFPTKSVEAMMNGTPMLCNLTSDLGLYLKHMKNSVVIPDEQVDSVRVALEMASEMSVIAREEMRRDALETAYYNFDYRVWLNELHALLKAMGCLGG